MAFATASVFSQTSTANHYANNITAAGLKKHLSIIASDSLEGRETGMPGQKMAADYIEKQFKRFGLEKPKGMTGYQQIFPLRMDSVITSSLKINGEEAISGKDFLVPLNDNEAGDFYSSAIVFAGYGIDDNMYSDYTQLDVAGKMVLIFAGEPKRNGKYFINTDGTASAWENDLDQKLKTAAEKGAAGAMVVIPNMATFSKRMLGRNMKSGMYFNAIEHSTTQKLHFFYASHEYARKIIGEDWDALLQSAKNNKLLNELPKEVKTGINFKFEKYGGSLQSSNVIGVIEGTDKKDEYVFLTAHYDHLGKKDGVVYNGADDDGSGTVAVLQMAEAFAQAKKEGKGPRRTVVCMTVSGEEKGLWGSEYYSEHPVFDLGKTSVDLNTDMIGRIDTERKSADTLNYVYVVGHDKISSELPVINEKVNNETTQLTLDYKFDDPKDPQRIYYRSDHYNFARKGVPVLFFYDGMLLSDYHQPTDDIEKIYWPVFEKRARMIFLTAWEMANRNDMLKRDKPLPTGTR